ncbi:MAG: hypothetical protein K2W95_20525 [Candidatus Obscuribacterales bacterium]|nr:hypothetical protein [Candidatus Obscuribacterales bacterium]
MGFENLLYRCDKNKIRIVSGDLQEGYWSLEGFCLVAAASCCGSPSPAAKVELAGNLSRVNVKECRESNSIGAFVGTGAGAIVGLRYYGLPGAVGGALLGHLLSGNHAQVCADVVLLDGRSFVATMSSGIFTRLSAIANRVD